MNTQMIDTATYINEDIQKLIKDFIKDRRARRLSIRTIEFYTVELKYFNIFLDRQEVVKISELTQGVIRDYLSELGTHRNRGGVHVSYRCIKALLNWWEEENDGDYRNPIRKIKIPHGSNQPLTGIRLDQFETLLNACTTIQSKRDKAILLFLLDTGVRASELVAIDIKDVDFISGSIVINHGKGDKTRFVYIGSKCKRTLKSYLKTRTYLRPNSALFTTDDDERLKFNGLKQIIRRLSKRAGIQMPGLHDFRRAFALNMIRNGVDLISISRLLGHSSVAVTQRYIAQNNEDLHIAHSKGSPVDNL